MTNKGLLNRYRKQYRKAVRAFQADPCKTNFLRMVETSDRYEGLKFTIPAERIKMMRRHR